MKLTIEKIDRTKSVTFTDKKTGQPKTLQKVGVFHQGDWYSCFQGEWNKEWKEGDTIEVEVERNGNYLNIQAPRKPSPMFEFLKEMKVQLDRIEAKIGGYDDAPPPEVTGGPVDDIPF